MKKLLLVLCMVLLSTMLFSFDWVQMSKFEKTYSAPNVKVLSSTKDMTVVKIDIAGFAKMPERAGNKDCYRIALPNTPVTREKGNPELPYVSFNIVVPDNSLVSVSVKENTESYSLDKSILPSKGPILRTVNPSKIPYSFNKKVYGNNAYYPQDDVTVSKPFVLRTFTGVRVQYNPVKYSPGTNTLVVAKSAVLTIKTVSAVETAAKQKKIEKEYKNIYNSAFLNFNSAVPSNAYDPISEKGYLHIIVPDEFANAVKPLVVWKKKEGFKVKVATISKIGKTPDKIKAYIQSEFDKGELCYVILVGDNEFVPCSRGVKENAPSDNVYVKLAGNDNIPDAIISRMSAKTVKEVEYLVYKSIQYESNPFTGQDAKFYTVAMGIASNQGNPTDSERCDELRDALLAYNYTKVSQVYDKSYSSPAKKEDVIKNINSGCGLINYIGHGSKTMIVSSKFGVTDMKKLHNGLKMPVMWDVACVNGQFNVGTDCFAEGFTKAGSKEAPAGAITVFASTTNQEWVPPCVVQKEIDNEIICHEKFQTVGGIAFNGFLKGFEVYGEQDTSSGTMLLEQWHIFGDCTLNFRSKVPEKLSVKASKRGSGIMIEVTGNSKTVQNAVVTCYDKDMNSVQISNLTNGKCSFENTGEKEKYITVTGVNSVPVVDYKVK